MKRIQTLRIVPILLLLVSMLVPTFGTATSWKCDGQTCGSTAWACCCVLGTCANSCPTSPSPVGNTPTMTSSNACHCEMIAAPRTPSIVTPVSVPTISKALFLPAPVTSYTFVLLATSPARRPETRGPPACSPRYVTPSLRAPPIA